MRSAPKYVVPGKWEVPRTLFTGKDVFILGGGPSLKDCNFAALDHPGNAVIAINNACELYPACDLVYFADRRWWNWNKDRLRTSGFNPRLVVSRSYIPDREMHGYDIKWIGRYSGDLSRSPAALAGWCSGANAINLAFLGDARRILLLGFDMRPGNWHELHKEPQKASHFQEHFIPSLTKMSGELRREGAQVFNLTPFSALTCFPSADPRKIGLIEKEVVQ